MNSNPYDNNHDTENIDGKTTLMNDFNDNENVKNKLEQGSLVVELEN